MAAKKHQKLLSIDQSIQKTDSFEFFVRNVLGSVPTNIICFLSFLFRNKNKVNSNARYKR